MPSQVLEIKRLGHQGDGVADGPIFVPMTLPGEQVEGEVVGDRLPHPRILHAVPERQKPPCTHYRACGGCSVQHARDDFVADWKMSIVRTALAAQGLEAEVSRIATSAPNTRRRATLHGRRGKSGAMVGFHARASDLLCEIPHCRVLDPALLSLLDPLHVLTERFASRKGEVHFALTATESGIHLAVTSSLDLPPQSVPQVLEILGETLCRLVWNGEVVALIRPPLVTLGDTPVTLPPQAFLQATREGEAALVGHVLRHTTGARRVLDLFAGLGTFSLPLAQRADVTACEGDKTMVAELTRAAQRHVPPLPVTAQTRDLFRQPLLASELKGFDAVVIDPPRAGALAQSQELARSDVSKIVSVSCNPETFARDAKILSQGGYRISDLLVVDQFRWSEHVELAAVLTKE